MNKFQWQNLYNYQTHKIVLSFVEISEDENALWVWGVCHREPNNLYKVAVRSKDRIILRTIEESMSLEEAKLQIEKKLFEDGILQEGTEIEDYTE